MVLLRKFWAGDDVEVEVGKSMIAIGFWRDQRLSPKGHGDSSLPILASCARSESGPHCHREG